MWSKRGRLPADDVLRGARPPLRARRRREDVDDARTRSASGAGGLSASAAAAWTGLRAGTPVAVANVDFHASVPAVGGDGARNDRDDHGHEQLPHRCSATGSPTVEGMCGVVEDGVVPGLFGFEAGQSAVGDIFAWFAERGVPPE